MKNKFLSVLAALAFLFAVAPTVAAPAEKAKGKGPTKEQTAKLNKATKAVAKLNAIADKLEKSGKKDKAAKLRQKIAKIEAKIRTKANKIGAKGFGKGKGKGKAEGKGKKKKKGKGKGKGKGKS